MEKRGLRDMIEFISEQFPGRIALTAKEAAQAFGKNEDSIYRYMNYAKNPLPHFKLGRGKTMIAIPALAQFMLNN